MQVTHRPTSKIPPIGGYYGGKASMVASVLWHFPGDVHTVVSPFCGFASVELNSAAPWLYLCDINPVTIAGLTAIRDRPQWLIMELTTAQWDRDFYRRCKAGDVDPAITCLALSAMCMQRGGSVSGFSQQQCDRARRRDWSYLHKVSARLQGQEIYCMDFRESMLLDSDALIYLDPPYLDGGQYYIHPMDESAHTEMINLALQHPGPVIISGYESELYNAMLVGWWRVAFPARNNKREKRTEMLWLKGCD